jgi:hypothetical protein
MSIQTHNIPARTALFAPPLPAVGRRRSADRGLLVKDLVRPLASRRGVRPHAADALSRLERRRAYLPI